ncbi:hypothetical protein O3M35_003362 [Rhynocoris fuscipes]|uniref:Uncharacterized protein n=1 Tax=Rhynocoris fuscipes TaxID=488301 RepID=A0AAW1CMT3_9HEMI
MELWTILWIDKSAIYQESREKKKSSTSASKVIETGIDIGRLSENVVLVWLSWESDCSARSRQHLIYFY